MNNLLSLVSITAAFLIGVLQADPFLLAIAICINLPSTVQNEWRKREASWHQGIKGPVVFSMIMTIPGAALNVAIFYGIGFVFQLGYTAIF